MWYRSNKNEAINIRFLSPEDANDVFEIYSDPQVTKNTNWERESVTFEAIKDFVDECIESFLKEDSVTYSVAKDNKVIALAFLHNLSEHPNWAEVGIMINKDYHKKKIGTSVIKKLIETSSYDNFYAVINPNNIGSRKLFEKLGFIYDPNLKRQGYISYIYRKSPQ